MFIVCFMHIYCSYQLNCFDDIKKSVAAYYLNETWQILITNICILIIYASIYLILVYYISPITDIYGIRDEIIQKSCLIVFKIIIHSITFIIFYCLFLNNQQDDNDKRIQAFIYD